MRQPSRYYPAKLEIWDPIRQPSDTDGGGSSGDFAAQCDPGRRPRHGSPAGDRRSDCLTLRTRPLHCLRAGAQPAKGTKAKSEELGSITAPSVRCDC